MKKPITPRLRSGRTKWDINYRVPGYKKVFTETFDTEDAARLRAAELTLDKQRGTLRPPDGRKSMDVVTLCEYLQVYIRDYGTQHWGDSYHTDVTRLVREYVEPSDLGRLLLKDIRASDLDRYYAQLLHTPAVVPPGKKDTGKTVGCSVIARIHAILRAALAQAVKWGYITVNPAANATVPKYEKSERHVWTPEIASAAIAACEDENLKCCILLGLGCSMRIGEVLGLRWSDLELTAPEPVIHITHQLQRCQKSSIQATDAVERKLVNFVFPERKTAGPCKTVLVLKRPKSRKSIRDNYIPKAVADALLQLQEEQKRIKEKYAALYTDFDLVFAQPDGFPIEERIIARLLAELIRKNDLPPVTFHSFRHLSTSMKLQYSGGDIKAVQADTGHAQSAMVTEVYSHTFAENRLRIAKMMNENFFQPEQGQSDTSPETDDRTRVMQLLTEHPEMTELILPLLEKTV